jgi:hypothetical protein
MHSYVYIISVIGMSPCLYEAPGLVPIFQRNGFDKRIIQQRYGARMCPLMVTQICR